MASAYAPTTTTPTASDQVRDAFAQAAYQGLLPRDRWAAAQALVCAYDDADEEGRDAIAEAITRMSREIAAESDNVVRLAA
jgi:hypothetical protein